MKPIIMLLALVLAAFTTMTVSANVITYSINLNSSTEVPPNASPGSGSGFVSFDGTLMKINLSFSGLGGNTTAAHIHCCAAPGSNARVATQLPTFPEFPLGVTLGAYDNTLLLHFLEQFDLTLASSYNPDFIVTNGGTVGGAMNALLTGAADGKAYFNIHTTAFPGGEIRGVLQPVPVPAALWLMGSALAGLIGMGRHRQIN